MRILENKPHPDGVMVTTLERGPTEDLLAYETDGFYKINGMVFSGHDIGVMQLVWWDSLAQEWKVPKP